MVFRIYALILLFRAIYWGIILNATGETKLVFYSSMITLTLNFVGNIVFCYIIGFIGPAISSLLVTAIMASVQLGFSCRIIHIRFSRILPWKSIFRYVVETFLFSCVFYAIRYGLLAGISRSASIPVSIVLGMVWTIIYAVSNKKNLLANWKNLNSVTYD